MQPLSRVRGNEGVPHHTWTPLPQVRRAWLGPAYFGGYLAYLFLRPESEALHWISLVLIPVVLTTLTLTDGSGGRLRRALAALGPQWGHLTTGLLWDVPLGLALSGLQLVLSARADAIRGYFADGSIVWMFPIVFLLMLLTAGFTEELFFRGFLQHRLERLTGSSV